MANKVEVAGRRVMEYETASRMISHEVAKAAMFERLYFFVALVPSRDNSKRAAIANAKNLRSRQEKFALQNFCGTFRAHAGQTS